MQIARLLKWRIFKSKKYKITSDSILHNKTELLSDILSKSLMDAYFTDALRIQAGDTVKINLTNTRINDGDAFSLLNGDIKINRKCRVHIYGTTALQIQTAGASASNLIIYVNGNIARVFCATSGEEIYSASTIPIDCILDLNADDIVSIYARPRKYVAAVGNDMTSIILQEL